MRKIFVLLFLLPLFLAYGSEGMWMPGYLNEQTRRLMKELGLEMPSSMIYDADRPSMKDAVVSFGGFCSGVVVSDDGLVFTNHHCGFEAIQQHSSVENDYLKDGFVARDKNEELPNEDLYVSFLIRTEDVTSRILNALPPDIQESQRNALVDSMVVEIQNEGYQKDSLLRYVVSPYYNGNEFYLSVYKDYNDVRLVYAPPSSVGKFGGDTDNWVWPRHTGDFAVFRIYADENNQPSNYSASNVPYKPDYVIPVSLSGYQEGDYCMTMGYPGRTERYLSSYGVIERRDADNAAMINVRGVKQSIWKNAMERDDAIRIKYASKYATSANYWKNSIGMNKAIESLEVIEQKKQLEQNLKQWIQRSPDERSKYLHILTNLDLNYRNRRSPARASAFFMETFLNSPELIAITFSILNFDFENDSASVEREKSRLMDLYSNMDISIDKEVFIAVLENYYNEVDSVYLPEVYTTIRNEYGNDYRRYIDYLYQNSKLTTPAGFEALMQNDSTFVLFDDPAAKLALDLLVKFYDFNISMEEASLNIEQNERLLNEAIRQMENERNFYPDANSTMRLSIGIINGYAPQNSVRYKYFTTTKGIFEKVLQYKGDSDFEVQPALLELLARRDFGKYADSTGEMNVCFVSDNDISGGNSGSGMFDSKGRLIGLAFDGNWEAMSGDLIFEPKYQRCIGVDIRYALYIMDKYSNASHLIDELNLSDTP